MVDDREQKAYTQINLLYSKNQTKSLTNFYYTSYIKNKFYRLTRPKYKLANIIKWQNMNQLRDRYYLRVLSNSKIPLTIKDFCASINKKWDTFGKDSIYNIKEINRVVEEFTDFCIQSLKDSNMKIIKCMTNTYQMANLCYLILFVGGLYHLEGYELAKNSRLVSKKDYEEKFKEFKMKYIDKKTSTINRNNKEYKDSEEGSRNEEEEDDELSNETYEIMSENYSESLFSNSQEDDVIGNQIENSQEQKR